MLAPQSGPSTTASASDVHSLQRNELAHRTRVDRALLLRIAEGISALRERLAAMPSETPDPEQA
jgi:hypothetical protein